MGWGDGTTQSNPCGSCVCPPWQEGQAGRWHGPWAPGRERRGRARDGLGCCARRYRVPVGTPNPPHPSRGSRTEHEPEDTHAVESLPPFVSDRPTPNVRPGNPRRRRVLPDGKRDRRSRPVYAEEDVIARRPIIRPFCWARSLCTGHLAKTSCGRLRRLRFGTVR